MKQRTGRKVKRLDQQNKRDNERTDREEKNEKD